MIRLFEKNYCIKCPYRFERFKRGVYGFCKLIVFALLFALFAGLISGCKKDKVQVYEVKTSGITYQTSAENKRIKEPVETETVFLVVGEVR